MRDFLVTRKVLRDLIITPFLLSLILFLSINLGVGETAQPRTWGFSGTATTSNITKTVGNASPFNPSSICVFNDGTSIDLNINMNTGVATLTNDSSNFTLKPGEGRCWSFQTKNTSDTFLIGFITASSTTTFRVEAFK